MTAPVDFSSYLQFVIESYKSCGELYTSIDLQAKIPVEKYAELGSVREEKTERREALAELCRWVHQKHKHLLLVGKPGSGKSMVLQRLHGELAQAAQADQGQMIPVLVQLKSLGRNNSILAAIEAEFRRAKIRVIPEQVDQWLMEERLLLLLDGVNELLSEEIEHQVRQFRLDNPDTKMIFTSRELGAGLGIEHKLEICSLTELQMRNFVGQYLPNYADLLLHQLNDRLRDLAETPLLLKLFCEVFDPSGQNIPQSKGELFRVVGEKYDGWKTSEGVRASEKFWQWNGELLSCLAFGMWQADGSPMTKRLQFRRTEAEQLLEGFLKDKGLSNYAEKAKDWLQDLLEHHLLQQVTESFTQIEFRHQLFQEYYAAEELLARLPNLSDAELKRNYLNLLKWTEPLAIVLSMVTDEALAIRVVKLAIEVDLILGARLAGEVKREFQKIAIGLLDTIKVSTYRKFWFFKLKQQVDVPDWLRVRLLAKTQSEVAILHLYEATQHEDFKVRVEAINELGELGSEQAVNQLIDKLNDRNSWVKRVTIKALSQFDSKRVVDSLHSVLNDSNPSVRLDAAEILAKLGSQQAILILVDLLECDEDFGHIQIWTADVLGDLGAERLGEYKQKVIFRLYNLLRGDSLIVARETKRRAGMAIGRLDINSRCEEYYRSTYNMFQDDEYVSQLAEEVFHELGTEEAVQRLIKLISYEQHTILRRKMAKALGKMGAKETVPKLLKLLKDPFMSWRVADILGEIGSEEAVPELLKALYPEQLHKQHCYLPQYAAKALGKIEGDKAAYVLPDLLMLIATESGQDAIKAISGIQNQCQFYNYEIWRSPPVSNKQRYSDKSFVYVYIERIKELKLMSYNQNNFNQERATVGVNINEGVIQNQEITQNFSQPSTEEAFDAVVKIVRALEQKYTFVQDEQQASNIIDAEFKEIKANQTPQWQNLLSLRRIYNGSKKAAIKVGEHFAEENVWGKGLVAFLEGASEDEQ